MGLREDHQRECTRCDLCLERCAAYDDEMVIDLLYSYLDGGGLDEGLDLSLCHMCGQCADVCPEGLGLIGLVREARGRWYREDGASPAACHSDPRNPDNIFATFGSITPGPDLKAGPAPVAYMPGCYAQYVHPYIAVATAKLLEMADVDHWVQADREGVSACCGLVSAGAGDPGVVAMNAERNVRSLKDNGTETLVCTCPVCTKAFKLVYVNMMGDHGVEVKHISQYLLGLVEQGKLIPKGVKRARVYYHDPCHLSLGLGIHEEPRELLRSIPGVELVNPSREGSTCCGFSGGVRMTHPSRSIDIARSEIDRLKDVDVIVTCCSGCEQNLIEASLEAGVKVVDIAEFLLLAMGEEMPRDDVTMVRTLNMAYGKAIEGYEPPTRNV
jgi:heterodisulfide reductase subunit D